MRCTYSGFKFNPVMSRCATALALAGLVTMGGCNSGGGSSTAGVSISGTVSAPGGTLAFNGPTLGQRMLAGIATVFGTNASAGITDLVSPVAGTPVEVFKVDAAGNVVGSAVSSGTTNADGTYTLNAPLDAPASQYIVRATGTTGVMDSRIISTTVNVDPVTDATSYLVTVVATDLAALSVTEIGQIQSEVSDLITDVTTSGTATDISANLAAEAQVNEEVLNVITSTVAPGSICGTVTKAGNAPLESVLVLVRDYSNWVTRAKTKTDSTGHYCLNVPFGDYIVGAINRTGDTLDPDHSGSEWYTSGGGAALQIDAERVSVPDATQVDVSFVLDPGIRIHGTVTASDAGSTEGMQVLVRDFDTLFPAASAIIQADGSYRVNVKPGRYVVLMRNLTAARTYATQYFNATGGTNLRGYADPVDVLATPTPGGRTVNFTVDPGYKLSGTITENATAVTGVRVLIDVNSTSSTGGVMERVRTNKNGQYRIWLKPDFYDIRSYGQSSINLDMSSNDGVADFSNNVAKLPVTVMYGMVPVSQAKVLLYGGTSGNTYIGNEVSSADGTLTIRADTANPDYKLLVRIDSPEAYGSSVYDTLTEVASGTSVDLTPGVTPTPITINLVDAGVLKVVVVDGSAVPQGNVPVSVRDVGTAGSNQFFSSRTSGDGVLLASVPGGTAMTPKVYAAIHVNGSGTNNGNCLNVPIANGMTTTVTFDISTGTCGAPVGPV